MDHVPTDVTSIEEECIAHQSRKVLEPKHVARRHAAPRQACHIPSERRQRKEVGNLAPQSLDIEWRSGIDPGTPRVGRGGVAN